MQPSQRLANFLLLLASLLAMVALCEVVVRAVRPASDIFPADPAPDPYLGLRILPHQSGHDARGFRNARATGQFAVVVIGDSQTYGSGIPRRYAFPQQLGQRLNQPVYNMGMGAYGPVQYYHLFRESRAMQPPMTIIAFYLGNYLLDAAHMATANERWHWLAGDFRPEEQPAGLKPCPIPCDAPAMEDAYQSPEIITLKLKESGSWLYQVHAFLRLHVALYALVYEAGAKPLVQRFLERQKHLERPGAFYNPAVNTVFMAGANLQGLDLRQERVQLGLVVTERVIWLLASQPEAKDRLAFTIIPTKERVYYDLLKAGQVSLPAEFECAVWYEAEISRWLEGVITGHGLTFLPVFPALAHEAAKGALLYPTSSDSHPNVAGSRVVAEALFQWLKKLDAPARP